MEGFRNFVIAVVIAILLPMITALAVKIVVPPPSHHAMVTTHKPWLQLTSEQKHEAQRHNEQEADFKDAMHRFADSYFYVALVGGLAAIAVGIAISIVSIGTGFIAGGFIMIVTAYASQWTTLSSIGQLSGLVLALLLIVGVAILRHRRSKKQDPS